MPLSGCGRLCCKSLFAPTFKNLPGCRNFSDRGAHHDPHTARIDCRRHTCNVDRRHSLCPTARAAARRVLCGRARHRDRGGRHLPGARLHQLGCRGRRPRRRHHHRPATTTPGRTPWRPRAAKPTPRAHSRSPRPTSRRNCPTARRGARRLLLPNITSLDGGVPIKLGNDVIGGVGVAGSPGKDEQCANAGLDKVKAALQ